jgi:cytosine permease
MINQSGFALSFLLMHMKEAQTIEPTSAMTSAEDDHSNDVVPLDERRGPVTLGLLWITMVCGFPSVLAGFEWFKAGLTMTQTLQAVGLSCLLLMAYMLPSCYLGAKSGMTYSLLSRQIFGSWGSRLVSANLVWVSIAWYGLTASFLATALKDLYHLDTPMWLLGAILAVLMGFNNYFGFSGIANFARYFAAPVMMAWVAFTFFKALVSCPVSVLKVAPTIPFSQALGIVSSFIVGYSVWGNEADYWRYGKPSKMLTTLPLAASLLVGQFIFPITGWMLARVTGVVDADAATNLMTTYSFGGITILSALVLAVSYFATNDSSLYGTINGIQNIHHFPRRKTVTVLTILGASTAALMPNAAQAFAAIAGISSFFLPCATVVMLVEYLCFCRTQSELDKFHTVKPMEDLPAVNLAAVIALFSGYIVGITTCGLIPALEQWHIGLCSLQSWLTCSVVYFVLRSIEKMSCNDLQSKDKHIAE